MAHPFNAVWLAGAPLPLTAVRPPYMYQKCKLTNLRDLLRDSEALQFSLGQHHLLSWLLKTIHFELHNLLKSSAAFRNLTKHCSEHKYGTLYLQNGKLNTTKTAWVPKAWEIAEYRGASEKLLSYFYGFELCAKLGSYIMQLRQSRLKRWRGQAFISVLNWEQCPAPTFRLCAEYFDNFRTEILSLIKRFGCTLVGKGQR